VSTVSLDALRDQFGSLSEPLGEALAALDRSGLQYGQLPREIPGTLCADGVASVGRAAHARLPGGCLGPALSIEDGWVLADALAYGPAPVDEALAALASRAGEGGGERVTLRGSRDCNPGVGWLVLKFSWGLSDVESLDSDDI
jgi:hypothetical protein